MKKIKILVLCLCCVLLVGCNTKSKTYGNSDVNWDEFNSKDTHIVSVFGKDYCYSDGSYLGNEKYNYWVNCLQNTERKFDNE